MQNYLAQDGDLAPNRHKFKRAFPSLIENQTFKDNAAKKKTT
jgi:hypothetical protein